MGCGTKLQLVIVLGQCKPDAEQGDDCKKLRLCRLLFPSAEREPVRRRDVLDLTLYQKTMSGVQRLKDHRAI